MSAYDKDGYIANGPVRPDQWKAVLPDMPPGLVFTMNAVPPGFLLAQNFIDPALCDAITRECEARAGEAHTVGKDGGSDATNSEARRSEYIDVRGLPFDIISFVRQTFANSVAPHFRKEIDWFELPEILRYREGGEYKPHADSDNWFPAEQTWKRVIDRDLSILIYLNEGFGGGEIVFPNFGLSLQPKKGLMIAFPSEARYLHAARPVTSGVRYALVSWAAVKGGERVGDGPRPHSIRM